MPTTDLPEFDSDAPENTEATKTYPVLPIPDGVIFPEMVVTVSLQSPDALSLIDGPSGPDGSDTQPPKHRVDGAKDRRQVRQGRRYRNR